MLYSRVPRSSAWPSIVKVYWLYTCSHCACFSRVAIDCGVSSVESDSKNTRSPTLTTKSCWLPGAALPAPAVGSPCLLAQPAAASARTKKPASLAARMTSTATFVMPAPPFVASLGTCGRSSRDVVKRKFLSTSIGFARTAQALKKSGNRSRWLMCGECGALAAPRVPRLLLRASVSLLQQWGPGRIGRVARRLQELLVAAGDVHRIQHRPAAPGGGAEEHDDAAVRRPCRPLVVIALGEAPLAGSVRPHDADGELALSLLGEGDVIAARRPHRRRIGAVAEADALRLAAARRHDVDLLLAAAVRLEADAHAVGRIGRRGVDHLRIGQTRRRPRAQIHHEQIGIAAALQTEDHALAVGREAWAEAHAGKVADDLALPGLDVHEIDFGIALAVGHVGDGVGRR